MAKIMKGESPEKPTSLQSSIETSLKEKIRP